MAGCKDRLPRDDGSIVAALQVAGDAVFGAVQWPPANQVGWRADTSGDVLGFAFAVTAGVEEVLDFVSSQGAVEQIHFVDDGVGHPVCTGEVAADAPTICDIREAACVAVRADLHAVDIQGHATASPGAGDVIPGPRVPGRLGGSNKVGTRSVVHVETE